jgi:hypothetical protein
MVDGSVDSLLVGTLLRMDPSIEIETVEYRPHLTLQARRSKLSIVRLYCQ